VPLLISITFHEWSHGFVAYKFGDQTPKNYGRLTLNPLAHLDLAGTLMLLIVGIGWAKPVPINLANLKNRTQEMLVALAGPVSNFILAVSFTVIVVLLQNLLINNTNPFIPIINQLFYLVIKINLILGIFNLLPVPPLDGSRIVAWLLPEKLEELYMTIAPYGMIILIIILFTVGFKSIFNIADYIEIQLFKLIQSLLSY